VVAAAVELEIGCCANINSDSKNSNTSNTSNNTIILTPASRINNHSNKINRNS